MTLVMVAGCSSLGTTPADRAGGISPDPAFGESTKYNAAVQIIDPDPVYAATDSQPGENGVRGAEAIKRYRTGAVKQVEQVSTSSGGSGGSGGGGGGGGSQ
jgi:hypothetical protein